MTDFGLEIVFDTSVLEFVSVDNTGTLSANLLTSGSAKSFGARIGGFSMGGVGSGPAGTLIKVNLKVKDAAFQNSTIGLQNLEDYVGGANTTGSTFTITGVTIAVELTPATTTDVVAGQPTTMTAAVTVNSAPLTLTDVTDFTFESSGNGAFGTKTIVSGNVQVDYTSHTTVESATITATENVTGNTNDDTATVTSIPGDISVDTSTVGSDETKVTTDNGATATITVTVLDTNNNPISGQNVTLESDGTNPTITQPTSVTDANGQTTGTIASTKAETIAVTGKIGTTAVGSVNVTFDPGAISQTESSVTANSPVSTDDGVATVDILVKDQNGNPIPGLTLHFVTSPITGVTDINDVGAAPTTDTGAASGSLSSTMAETKTITVKSGTTTVGAVDVIFEPGAIDTTNSTVGTSADKVTTDGGATATITVTLLDANNNPIPGQIVILESDGTDPALTQPTAVTDANGQATGTIASAIAEDISVTAKVGATTIGNVSVTFDPGNINTTNSTVNTDAANVTTDDGAIATITVTVLDAQNNPIPNQPVTLESTGSDNVISQPANTDAAGQTTGTIASIKAETKTVTAKAGDTVLGTVDVIFDPGAVTQFRLDVSKNILASDGKGTADVTATVMDQNGNDVLTDAGTSFAFDVTDGSYLQVDASPVSTTDGVAATTITTINGVIPAGDVPFAEAVTATSGSLTGNPGTQALTIVNFSINVDSIGGVATPNLFLDANGVHLVTSGSTPNAAIFTGLGGTSGSYNWALDSVGTITSTTTDTTTYNAPATLTSAPAKDTLTLTSTKTGDESLIDTIDINIYNPVTIAVPANGAGIEQGDNTRTMVVSGGTGTYKFQSSDITVAVVDPDTGDITPATDKTGTFTVEVRDVTYGVFGTANGFMAISETMTVVTPIAITNDPANNVLQSATTNDYDFTGSSGTVNWTTTAGTIDADGVLTAPTLTSGSQVITITATDSQFPNIKATTQVTVYAILVIHPSLVVVDGSTLQFDATGGTGGDTNANYTWTVNLLTGSTSGSIVNGLFTPVDGTGVRTFTVTATDKTHTIISGTSATITIVDPLAITGDPAGNALESANITNNTNDYNFSGGTETTVNWTATAGTIDTNGVYTAPTVTTGSQVITITATDSQFASVTATTQVTVYADISITDKPATEPTVESGANSGTFNVAGGDDTLYTWTVTGPVAVAENGANGASFSFTAPTTGDFAGQYTVTVTDNKDFTDSFTVLVPMSIDPTAKVLTTAEPMDVTVDGTSSTVTFEILDAADAVDPVETPADYGTWTSATSNPNTFTPADINDTMVFFVRITSDDATLAGLGLDVLVSGPYRIVKVAEYTVTVSGGGTELPNIDVTVNGTTQTTDTNGQTIFNLPDTGGTYMYLLEDATNTFIPQEISSNRTAVSVTMEEAGEAFTGTVTSGMGGILANVDVAALYEDASGVVVAATTVTAGDGTYTLYVPASAPAVTYDIMASLDGYQNALMTTRTPATAPGTTVDIALWPSTSVNVVATEGTNSVTMKITANPAFDNSDDGAAAFEGTQLQVTLIDPDAVATGTLSTMTYSAADNSYTIVYSALEDFTVQILADTSADRDVTPAPAGGDEYILETVYVYLVGTTTGTTATGAAYHSGSSLGVTANGQDALVEVPTGGIGTNAAIAIRQTAKDNAASTSTDGSPTYIYEVVATDLTTGDELTAADINRIEITLPIDLTVIGPGDLEKGVFTIYHAVSQTALEAGGGTAVPVANIISSDYVGNGIVGSVTFWVNSLSYFGVGSAATGPKLIESSDDTRCFIATAAFGSPFETHVTMLRKFRDTYLMPTSAGRAFVNAYYRLSPPMADFIAEHDSLRAAVRVALMPAVGMSYMMMNFGMLQTMLLFSVMLALAFMLTFRLGFFTRKEQ